MPKPILIVYAPDRTIKSVDHERIRIMAMQMCQGEYFVFVVPTSEREFRFEALFEKDFDEVKYQELQEKLLQAVGIEA